MVSSEILSGVGGYLAPFSGSVYGEIVEIPDFLSVNEMSRIADLVSTESIDSNVYPNRHIWKNTDYEYAFDKIRYLWDNWSLVSSNRSPNTIREALQASPAHMREYPMHTDHGGKALTILVPISPSESTPTRFHGDRGQHPIQTIPWRINHAYMFIPDSQLTYHSYIGGKYDRYVLNINFLYDTMAPLNK